MSLSKIIKLLKIFSRSIWFFPAILTVILVLLTFLQISGSSIGVYHKFFYGDSVKDNNLIFGTPRPIRGDEWNSTTQLRIGQMENKYEQINSNIGDGQDLSILDYGPYKDWSVIFKPRDLAFFIMPFDNAFAFSWWLMLYLLIISCYFFILFLLPKKKLLAGLLSIGFAFSPFIQWWYLYGTLGSIYYALFAGTIFMILLNTRHRLAQIAWGCLLAYTLVCFALVLYPPFQILCALVIIVFSLGYFIEKLQKTSIRKLVAPLMITVGAILVALLLTVTYLNTRKDAVKAMTNTAYPGKRIVKSGEKSYPPVHLLSGQFSVQLMNPSKADHYPFGGNQSEASNFILLLPALFLPGVLLLILQYKKKKKIDWPLLVTSILFILLLIRLYIPRTDLLFKFLFLESIPNKRTLIGFGILSFIHMVLLIRSLDKTKLLSLHRRLISIYCLLLFILYIFIGIHTFNTYTGFIGLPKALLLSLIIPIIVLLILRKHFILGALMFFLFGLFSAGGVNPLYANVSSITNSDLSRAIQRISATNNERWAADSIVYEHFPVMNGAHSLTGVYSYPQFSLWENSNTSENIYNRYAHIRLSIDREPNKLIESKLVLASQDTIDIVTEPCSTFLQKKNVRFILTETAIPDNCVNLIEVIKYPYRSFFIYKIVKYSP